jgi:RimJ/RimL family protein N-acetyltransferase
MTPVAIHTERLNLVPLEVAHADEMAAVLADPALHTFIGGEPSSATELRARYERLVAGSPDPEVSWCNWVIALEDSHELAGTVQATITKAGTMAEIAWVVGRSWQGRGLATEAARALVLWLRASGVTTIVAHVHPDHHAAAAVAAAAGLERTDEWEDGEVRWRLSTA